MKRWQTLLAAGATIATLTGATPMGGAVAQEKVLRLVPQADLKNLDPIWTTAAITINHGFMIYDTLFALDSKLQECKKLRVLSVAPLLAEAITRIHEETSLSSLFV